MTTRNIPNVSAGDDNDKPTDTTAPAPPKPPAPKADPPKPAPVPAPPGAGDDRDKPTTPPPAPPGSEQRSRDPVSGANLSTTVDTDEIRRQREAERNKREQIERQRERARQSAERERQRRQAAARVEAERKRKQALEAAERERKAIARREEAREAEHQRALARKREREEREEQRKAAEAQRLRVEARERAEKARAKAQEDRQRQRERAATLARIKAEAERKEKLVEAKERLSKPLPDEVAEKLDKEQQQPHGERYGSSPVTRAVNRSKPADPIDFVPIVGTERQGERLVKNWDELNNTQRAAGSGLLALSAVGDALLIYGVGAGIKSAVGGAARRVTTTTAASSSADELVDIATAAQRTNVRIATAEIVAAPDADLLAQATRLANKLPDGQQFDVVVQPNAASIQAGQRLVDAVNEARPAGAPRARMVVEIDKELTSAQSAAVAREVTEATRGVPNPLAGGSTKAPKPDTQVVVRSIDRGSAARSGLDDVVEARVNQLKEYSNRPRSEIEAEVRADVAAQYAEAKKLNPDLSAREVRDLVRRDNRSVDLEEVKFGGSTEGAGTERTLRLEPEPPKSGGRGNGGGVATKEPKTDTTPRITGGGVKGGGNVNAGTAIAAGAGLEAAGAAGTSKETQPGEGPSTTPGETPSTTPGESPGSPGTPEPSQPSTPSPTPIEPKPSTGTDKDSQEQRGPEPVRPPDEEPTAIVDPVVTPQRGTTTTPDPGNPPAPDPAPAPEPSTLAQPSPNATPTPTADADPFAALTPPKFSEDLRDPIPFTGTLFPRIVQWRQGAVYKQLDLANGRETTTSEPVKGGVNAGKTPQETLKVIKRSSARPRVRVFNLGAVMARVETRQISFSQGEPRSYVLRRPPAPQRKKSTGFDDLYAGGGFDDGPSHGFTP